MRVRAQKSQPSGEGAKPRPSSATVTANIMPGQLSFLTSENPGPGSYLTVYKECKTSASKMSRAERDTLSLGKPNPLGPC